MKHRQFIDELKSLGVTIVEGKSHYKAYYKGRQTVVKRHPSHEFSNKYMKLVKKQLGIR